VYQGQKVHLFRSEFSGRGAAEADRRGQKALFGDRTNYKAKDIIGKISN
jgi:hypothetical protein